MAGMAVCCPILTALDGSQQNIQPLEQICPVNAWAPCEDEGKVVAYKQHFPLETRTLLPVGAITL